MVAQQRLLDAKVRFVAGVAEPHVEAAETLGEAPLDHLVDDLDAGRPPLSDPV